LRPPRIGHFAFGECGACRKRLLEGRLSQSGYSVAIRNSEVGVAFNLTSVSLYPIPGTDLETPSKPTAVLFKLWSGPRTAWGLTGQPGSCRARAQGSASFCCVSGSGWLSGPWLAGPKVPVELGPTPARISGRAQIAQNSGRALRLLVYIYRIDQCSAQAGAPGFFQLCLHFVLLARLSEFATQGAK